MQHHVKGARGEHYVGTKAILKLARVFSDIICFEEAHRSGQKVLFIRMCLLHKACSRVQDAD